MVDMRRHRNGIPRSVGGKSPVLPSLSSLPGLAMVVLSARGLHLPTAYGLSGTIFPRNFRAALQPLQTKSVTSLSAKRKTKKDSNDDMSNWYDSVDDNATPDDVFWEEMERQRLVNQIGGGDISREIDMMAALTSSSSMPPSTSSGGADAVQSVNGSPNLSENSLSRLSIQEPSQQRKAPSMEEQKSAEATLSQYTIFQVPDNWLNEDLQFHFDPLNLAAIEEELTIEEETKILEEKLEALPDGAGASFLSPDENEPWEHFGSEALDETPSIDVDRAGVLQVEHPSEGKLSFIFLTSRTMCLPSFVLLDLH